MIADFQELLNKFSLIKESSLSQQRDFDISAFKELLYKYEPCLDKIRLLHKKDTPFYNLFKVLRIEFLEAAVHTPFLANLLNHRGTHSQDKLFFNSFLENVLKVNIQSFMFLNDEYLNVIAEHKTTYGIIDILIYYRHPIFENRFAIIIENKIFAGDQEKQLERYYNYTKQKLKLCDDQIILVYLTPYQSLPSDHSLREELKKGLLENGVLKLVTYNPDIKSWLLECCEEIQSEKLKQTIIQYTEILNQFPHEQD